QLPEITKPGARILDMGCGYGTAGVILSRIYGEDVDVVMADVNRRAVELAKRNLELNGASAEVILSDGFGRLTGSFDYIILNPPIHAGKAVIYRMYEDSREYLNTGGALCLVIRKKHGALSHKQKLGEIFGKQPENLSVLYSKKGIYVFKCVKT
ncbi:MAG: methyltransferase, partial [Oscillospiraceae bacterium]|nr:methyltransferase [Oscillospiraceae bacterium]